MPISFLRHYSCSSSITKTLEAFIPNLPLLHQNYVFYLFLTSVFSNLYPEDWSIFPLEKLLSVYYFFKQAQIVTVL